jgi:hypothetical protein
MNHPEKDNPAVIAYEEAIRENVRITAVSIAYYPDPPRAQERIQFSHEDQRIIQVALEAKAKTGTSFWDSVLLAANNSGNVSPALLDAISFHQDLTSRIAIISRADVLDGRLRSLALDPIPDQNVALLSRVQTQEGPRHFPMVDFACAVNEKNEDIVKAISGRLIAGPFVVACSGMSYHAFGSALADESQRVAMLGLAVQFGPVVDRSFISHQLRQGFSALRISSGPNKRLPIVIWAADESGGESESRL